MTYQEVLEWIQGQLKFGIKPGLERMRWCLAALDNPQEKLVAVHVVGTNGKGSTVNNLQHILTQSGYEVGTFTSPYIMDFKERISLNGQMISEADLVLVANRVKPVAKRLIQETSFGQLTEFELITLIMFVYFGQVHPVDIAVIEAGLGGLYDSTNVFQAELVICPSIGLDHQAILGSTYQAIAKQKAGVIKGSEPVLIAISNPDARQVFVEQAAQLNSSLYEFSRDFNLQKAEQGFYFTADQVSIAGIDVVMPGKHQVSNAALAIMAACLLRKRFPKISAAAIKRGLAESYWQGRTELLAQNVMIDGAHNRESVLALIEVLKERYAPKKIHILFAAIDTKPIAEMLDLLEDQGDLQVTTFSHPKAYPLDAYPAKYPKVAHFRDWLAKRHVNSNEDFYLVTGSLYFIAQVRQYWFNEEPTSVT
ncbi:bifunctional folylpolyglutamate synthase/dihydrofolate synthase [Streptococcus halichoeri]|uniref:bifunctional folylpolyglutamate synthase/dihydrofolate synthase n=1 Tax=Streptococcus halichoeri TaxID=254785 RepID=UPI001358D0EE|nr:folylpolyglutamate synthase/dihydrofolate synthase family protein [Streptococcus halichoeri]